MQISRSYKKEAPPQNIRANPYNFQPLHEAPQNYPQHVVENVSPTQYGAHFRRKTIPRIYAIPLACAHFLLINRYTENRERRGKKKSRRPKDLDLDFQRQKRAALCCLAASVAHARLSRRISLKRAPRYRQLNSYYVHPSGSLLFSARCSSKLPINTQRGEQCRARGGGGNIMQQQQQHLRCCRCRCGLGRSAEIRTLLAEEYITKAFNSRRAFTLHGGNGREKLLCREPLLLCAQCRFLTRDHVIYRFVDCA